MAFSVFFAFLTALTASMVSSSPAAAFVKPTALPIFFPVFATSAISPTNGITPIASRPGTKERLQGRFVLQLYSSFVFVSSKKDRTQNACGRHISLFLHHPRLKLFQENYGNLRRIGHLL